MARLTRAETQERTRARVLAAARDEFAQSGFRAARIDDIAERAELTRGAVYSNFPGKRALYFAVLADLAEHGPATARPAAQPGHSAPEALGSLARAWVARLPQPGLGTSTGADSSAGAGDVADERGGTARLGVDLIPEVMADARLRGPYLQLLRLDALLLALALERVHPLERTPGAPPRRSVRMAETVLTTLHGASRMAAAAPGFIEPFDVISACEQLAGLELSDWWAPPTAVPPARRTDDPWAPHEATDLVTGRPAPLTSDGVVAVLGPHRLSAVEEAVRTAPPGTDVTAVLVAPEPHEAAPLARLVVAELTSCLREAFPQWAWPRLRVVCDPSGALAAAAGVPGISETTEAAVGIGAGRILARAEGSGACHAVAAASLVTSGP
ncbi:TetR/AcrR family transcriptional regulator [Streptomyces sp. NPDC002133]|uniref:TetR/AcrR family transcriptional regulator n=1 Tax=Streptomyces sp. NPDC002133 TaxID=3154409 RepID=UPI00332EC585